MRKVDPGKLPKPSQQKLAKSSIWRVLGRLKPCTDGLALCDFASISAMRRSREKIAQRFEGLFREWDGVSGQDK